MTYEGRERYIGKAEIASKYKAILNPLLKSMVTNSGLIIFPHLSPSLVYISTALLNLEEGCW